MSTPEASAAAERVVEEAPPSSADDAALEPLLLYEASAFTAESTERIRIGAWRHRWARAQGPLFVGLSVALCALFAVTLLRALLEARV
jgi:hypothetical protein